VSIPSSRCCLCAAQQGLEEARAALEAEQARGVQLEVALAEARRELGRMEELERELQRYRQGADRKGSGIWGYISGQ
jgi:hypothetical protein